MNISEDYAHALKHIEAKKKGLIGFYWDTNGKFLHDIGWRYSISNGYDRDTTVNWTTRDTLKTDAKRFANSKYAMED
jgi:hypothetical protein